MSWFSSYLTFIIHVDDEENDREMGSVYVFKATDWDHALEKAINIGSSEEESYTNKYNQTVTWIFKEVKTLDIITEKNIIPDKTEVWSSFSGNIVERSELKNINPEDSDPFQTI